MHGIIRSVRLFGSFGVGFPCIVQLPFRGPPAAVMHTALFGLKSIADRITSDARDAALHAVLGPSSERLPSSGSFSFTNLLSHTTCFCDETLFPEVVIKANHPPPKQQEKELRRYECARLSST